MKRSEFSKLIALALASALTVAGGTAFAARPDDPGGGGGGGGKPAPDYGDLIKLYRDEYGVPLLTADGCWQPLPSETCVPACGLVAGIPESEPVTLVIPVNATTCAVVPECITCTQEVDFGRVNEARSPDDVFAAQLQDVVVKLATADCVTLDPAGRLVASSVDRETLVVSSSAIDSPLQNLAIYKQLMQTGDIGVDLPEGVDLFDTAARSLGAASDKAGEVGVDMVAYVNMIMGLSDPPDSDNPDDEPILGKICIPMKEEVKGTIQWVTKCFLNYGETIDPDTDDEVLGADYQYARVDNFSTTQESLPYPAYIPDETSYGWFEYLAVPELEIVQGPILDAVFGADPGFTDGNIGGFAQATDDTRAVIEFMHSHAVPAEMATAVPCEPSTELAYDLSISEVSGLQVPVRMVAGTEGREFTVSVANAGPGDATGTVTVTAVDDDEILIEDWTFSFEGLVPGSADATWTRSFSIDYKTTITWTATVEADPPERDVYDGNNQVTETTTVIGGGGGGGNGGGNGGNPN